MSQYGQAVYSDGHHVNHVYRLRRSQTVMKVESNAEETIFRDRVEAQTDRVAYSAQKMPLVEQRRVDMRQFGAVMSPIFATNRRHRGKIDKRELSDSLSPRPIHRRNRDDSKDSNPLLRGQARLIQIRADRDGLDRLQ